MLLPIIRFFQNWKRYGLAVQELSQLSDRELADIGITAATLPVSLGTNRTAKPFYSYGDPMCLQRPALPGASLFANRAHTATGLPLSGTITLVA